MPKLTSVSKHLRLLTTVCVVICLLSSCKNITPPEKTIAYKNASDYWHVFRKNFPYHIQTIGISPKEADSSFVLIISEPPPQLTLDSVKDALKGSEFSFQEETNPIGYDGWVKDIVVTVSEMSDSKLEKTRKRLGKLLFATDEGTTYLDFMNVNASKRYSLPNTNYNISAAELYTWFVKQGEEFVDKEGFSRNMDALLTNSAFGVYHSVKPGFVVWMLPKGNIDDYKTEARYFSLESDLVLGAFENSYSLAIVARQRKIPVWQLPPLRTETIMMLAGADKKKLAQSYERTKPFAGKLPDGKDWAPIYLSKELLNTEYGSLLNITDQLLKSWSQNGHVSYVNFVYKKPRDWCFSRPVAKELNTNSVLFNWNTHDAVYSVNVGDNYAVYALNRTGSLPVSYNPDDERHNQNKPVLHAEDKAYDFFSSLNDPNLVRVVQYAAIYEIFSKTNVYSTQSNLSFHPDGNQVIQAHLASLFNNVKNVTEEQEDSIYKHIIEPYFEKGIENSSDASYYRLVSAYLFYDFIDKFKGFVERQQDFISTTLQVVSGDRDMDLSQVDEDEYSAADSLNKLLHDNYTFLPVIASAFGDDISKIKNEYAALYNQSQSNWIKTPSIVISWDYDSANVVGGHNLDVAVNTIKKEAGIEEGTLRISKFGKETEVALSEADLFKVSPQLIAKYERLGEGEYHIADELNAVTIRQRELVIPSADFHATASTSKYKWSYTVNGERHGIETIDEGRFYSHPFNENLLIPENRFNNYNAIYTQMKARRYIPEEMEVVSFIRDDKTNRILDDYLHGQLHRDVETIDDLGTLFEKNPRKSFILFGHIDNQRFAIENAYGESVTLKISDVQALASRYNTNIFIMGCESSFAGNGADLTGMINKFYSTDAAERLGFALKKNNNVWDFFNDMSDQQFQVIIDNVPFADQGYAVQLQQRHMVAAQVIVTVGGVTTVLFLVPNTAPPVQQQSSDSTQLKNTKSA
jgi:hypothetical protein